MPNWLKSATILLLAPPIAAISASASLSTVLARKAPERAIQLPVVDANAYANLATDNAALARAGGEEGARDDLRSRAQQAFRSEPTSSRAISLLALSRQLEGDTEAARRLYADALMLSQRDRLASLSLIEDASQRGWVGFILDRYDVLLRTGGATSDTLFSVLATALREEAIVPHLETRLAKRPPWAEQFWLRVTPNPDAIENVGRLRLRLLSRQIDNAAGNDADIVRRLVDHGHFALAYRLFSRVSEKAAHEHNLLRNGEFSETPVFVPFDWATFSDARYTAEVDPVIGALVVFTETSLETPVAAQLVKLPRGRYSVNLRTRDPESASFTPLSVRIRCADPSGAGAQPAVHLNTGGWPRSVDYAAHCEFSWVEIWARYDATSLADTPSDVVIEAIHLVPAGSAPARSETMGAGVGKAGNPAPKIG